MQEITYFSGCGENRKEVDKLNVKDRISLVDQGTAATLIAEAVFEGEEYCPYKYEYAFWYWIIREYTDFDTAIDMDEFMDVIETTDITIQVSKVINDQQFDNIESSARELINRRLNRSEFDNLCANLNRIVNKYDEQIGAFLNSKKAKKIFENLSKAKFDQQSLVDAFLASQQSVKE